VVSPGELVGMLKREWYPMLAEMREALNTWEHPQYRIPLNGRYLTVAAGDEAGYNLKYLGAEDSVFFLGGSVIYSATESAFTAWFNPSWFPSERFGYADRKIYLEVDAYWTGTSTSVEYGLYNMTEGEEVDTSKVVSSTEGTRQYLITSAIDAQNPDDATEDGSGKLRDGVNLYVLTVEASDGVSVLGAFAANIVVKYERPT